MRLLLLLLLESNRTAAALIAQGGRGETPLPLTSKSPNLLWGMQQALSERCLLVQAQEPNPDPS